MRLICSTASLRGFVAPLRLKIATTLPLAFFHGERQLPGGHFVIAILRQNARVGDAFGAFDGVLFEPDQPHCDISSGPWIR
jgi:hypothetical protein